MGARPNTRRKPDRRISGKDGVMSTHHIVSERATCARPGDSDSGVIEPAGIHAYGDEGFGEREDRPRFRRPWIRLRRAGMTTGCRRKPNRCRRPMTRGRFGARDMSGGPGEIECGNGGCRVWLVDARVVFAISGRGTNAGRDETPVSACVAPGTVLLAIETVVRLHIGTRIYRNYPERGWERLWNHETTQRSTKWRTE